jgi:hypothetical protein
MALLQSSGSRDRGHPLWSCGSNLFLSVLQFYEIQALLVMILVVKSREQWFRLTHELFAKFSCFAEREEKLC